MPHASRYPHPCTLVESPPTLTWGVAVWLALANETLTKHYHKQRLEKHLCPGLTFLTAFGSETLCEKTQVSLLETQGSANSQHQPPEMYWVIGKVMKYFSMIFMICIDFQEVKRS